MLSLLTTSPVLPALLAAVAAALVVSSPGRQLSRTGTNRGRLASNAFVARLRGWATGRPDAAPLRRRLVVAGFAGVACGLALQAFGIPPAGAWVAVPALAAAAVVVLAWLEPAETRRRRERLVSDLPHALELLASCLQAGMPLRSAVRAVASAFEGPVREDLSQVLALTDLGTGDAEAWATLRGSPEWRPAAVDLARSFDSGTQVVEVLLQHASDARGRRRAAIEVKARGVGVRSVLPLMTCFLPAFVLLGVVPAVASALLNALP